MAKPWDKEERQKTVNDEYVSLNQTARMLAEKGFPLWTTLCYRQIGRMHSEDEIVEKECAS